MCAVTEKSFKSHLVTLPLLFFPLCLGKGTEVSSWGLSFSLDPRTKETHRALPQLITAYV